MSVEHREDAMEEFIRKHEARIHGVLSCFDRMLFRGYLPIMSGWSMAQFLNGLDVDGGSPQAVPAGQCSPGEGTRDRHGQEVRTAVPVSGFPDSKGGHGWEIGGARWH